MAIDPPTASPDWHSTGVWHTEDCGCVYGQQVEHGTADYHERWRRLLRCPRHGLGADSAVVRCIFGAILAVTFVALAITIAEQMVGR